MTTQNDEKVEFSVILKSFEIKDDTVMRQRLTDRGVIEFFGGLFLILFGLVIWL